MSVAVHSIKPIKIDKPGTLWSMHGKPVFKEMFDNAREIHSEGMFKPKHGDVLLLHGGGDIWPGFYGEKPISQCLTKSISIRDISERRVAEAAIEQGIPIIGICRGAQWCCILAGGSLFQHVNGHDTDHQIKTDDDQIFWTPQAHHQMMRTFMTCHEAIAWSHPAAISDVYLVGEGALPVEEWEQGWEIEVVFFPTVTGLGFQGHPDWAYNQQKTKPFYGYCQTQIEKWILGR